MEWFGLEAGGMAEKLYEVMAKSFMNYKLADSRHLMKPKQDKHP